MTNKIQIKRSTANASVTGLSNGELAFTQASNTLHIGLPDGSGVLRIGGAQYPGTLTNSHALVANSTGGIDKIIVANAVITGISANGSVGTAGQVLVSNGSTVYWGTGTSGSNTYVQFNDSGVANGVGGFTFDKVDSKLYIGNSVSTAYITALNGSRNITTNYGSVSGAVGVATDLTVGASGSGGNVIAAAVYATGTVNGAIIGVGTQFFANTTQVVLSQGMKLSANGALGSANQVLRTDSSGTAYWADDVGDISGITAGDGLTGGGTSGDITVSVGSGNGISVSTDAIAVNANDGIVSNSSGVFVKAGTGVTVNATGVHIGQAVGTTDNVTFANVVTQDLKINGNTILGDSGSDRLTFNALVTGNIWPSSNNAFDIGSNTLRWNNIYANSVTVTSSSSFGGNVSIDGTLTVSGNLVTQNVQSIIVSDPMIYLAGNNYSSDLLDIGFAANYNDGVTNRHTGLFRDHTDGLYKLFYNLTQELSGNNDVDVSDASYRTATLVAYLSSGALSTNSTSANLTANSTVSVGIVANTLTLSTALAGTSGGTGLASYTAEDLLVANSSNGFRKLGLGTSGYVLQSNGSALIYDSLDGGVF